jgi:hypothetical protein
MSIEDSTGQGEQTNVSTVNRLIAIFFHNLTSSNPTICLFINRRDEKGTKIYFQPDRFIYCAYKLLLG